MPFRELSQIISPQDIKEFSFEDLEALALQIRQRIIDVMAINGGHLASNLGIVELTLALHKVFNSPHDKLIFDVSHQCYPHKLITGRHNEFDSIRKYKGLCGFANPQESPHDAFYAGHAGTALSLALGVAKGRDLNTSDETIIPILGDASLTCGLTLEALNNIPKDLSKFIVILNDNKMSISNNVGAISTMLSRIINSPTSNRLYHSVESLLSKIPSCGSSLAKQSHRLTDSVKGLVSSAPFFEEFGLSYVGPIDGHDMRELIHVLEALKDTKTPVLLHVITTKGKGLESAIANPISWHGCRPFDKSTCKFLPNAASKATFPQVFGKHLLELAEKDPSIVTITPAMLAGSCLTQFAEKYPDRCIDVGIAEGHSVTYAGGIASYKNLKVVSSLYATFAQRAFDNIFQDVCLQEAPVVFALDRAGFSPADGSTHHGIYDIAFLNAMPNMVITQPRNGQVLKELLESAFDWKKPTVIRYPNLTTTEDETPLRKRELGKGEILSQGKDILIVALGHMHTMAMDIKQILREEDLNPTIVDPVFVKPLDHELFISLLSTHSHIITLEEHSVNAGLGMILNHFIIQNSFSHLTVQNFGIPDRFVEQGTHKELLAEIGLEAPVIAASILKKTQKAHLSKSHFLSRTHL